MQLVFFLLIGVFGGRFGGYGRYGRRYGKYVKSLGQQGNKPGCKNRSGYYNRVGNTKGCVSPTTTKIPKTTKIAVPTSAAPAPTIVIPPVSGIEKLVTGVYITFYGFDDNDNGQGTYAVNTISDPVIHQVATEDLGTYDNPTTFAGDEKYRFTKAGDIIYVPRVQKYYIMEDTCRECTADLNNSNKNRIDLFMGGNTQVQGPPLISCEEAYTLDPFTDSIILNPKKTYPVSTTPLFANGVCKPQ